MGMVKRKMMEVQEEAWDAFEEGSEVNPYKDTMWERCWQQAYDGCADDYGNYLDLMQEKEDYLRSPAAVTYFDLDRPGK